MGDRLLFRRSVQNPAGLIWGEMDFWTNRLVGEEIMARLGKGYLQGLICQGMDGSEGAILVLSLQSENADAEIDDGLAGVWVETGFLGSNGKELLVGAVDLGA